MTSQAPLLPQGAYPSNPYFRVIFYLLRPSFETEGAVLGTARCEPEDLLDMEVLSSVPGRVLDVLDGALDDATWNGSAINS